MTHHKLHFPKTVDGWKAELKKAWGVITLKKEAMASVVADEKAMGPAVAFIVLAALAGALGTYIFPTKFYGVVYRPGLDWVLAQAIFCSVMMVLAAVLFSLIAEKLFKGKASMVGYFKVFGFASLIGVIALVPALGFISFIWMAVLVFVTLRTIHGIGVGDVIVTMILGVIALGIVSIIVSSVFGIYGVSSYFDHLNYRW